MSVKPRFAERGVVRGIVVVLGCAVLAEGLMGEGPYRLLGVGEFALALILMLAVIALMMRLKSRWAESLTFGAGLGVLGLLGDLFNGDGFDWLLLMVAIIGGTLGWFVALWLNEQFVGWRRSRAASKRVSQ